MRSVLIVSATKLAAAPLMVSLSTRAVTVNLSSCSCTATLAPNTSAPCLLNTVKISFTRPRRTTFERTPKNHTLPETVTSTDDDAFRWVGRHTAAASTTAFRCFSPSKHSSSSFIIDVKKQKGEIPVLTLWKRLGTMD